MHVTCFFRLLVITILSIFLGAVDAAPKTDTLQLVHVFFRHGDRTPDGKDFYPTDPYKNYSFYPMGLGQLTNAGKLREYELGKLLRKTYNYFLGAEYVPESVTATSSDYGRTKMSLLLVLAGLWPPSSMQQWNPELPWQPVPFKYQPASQDHFIQRPLWYCPKYRKELDKVMASQDVTNFIESNQVLFKFVQEMSGKPMNTVLDMFDVYQNLNSEHSLGLALPEWTKVIYPEPLHSVAGMVCKFENYNNILKRLNGGHGLKLVLQHGKAKMENQPIMKDRKIVLLSGHENNVVNVLAALNLFEPHVPKYGSAVLFELHKDNGNYAYRVLHHNQQSNEPRALKLEGCTEYCPLEKFISLTASHVPGNYTEECESEINLDDEMLY